MEHEKQISAARKIAHTQLLRNKFLSRIKKDVMIKRKQFYEENGINMDDNKNDISLKHCKILNEIETRHINGIININNLFLTKKLIETDMYQNYKKQKLVELHANINNNEDYSRILNEFDDEKNVELQRKLDDLKNIYNDRMAETRIAQKLDDIKLKINGNDMETDIDINMENNNDNINSNNDNNISSNINKNISKKNKKKLTKKSNKSSTTDTSTIKNNKNSKNNKPITHKKKKKKPGKKSGYNLWFGQRIQELRAENPEMTFGEISKKCSEEWRSLDNNKRSEFNAKAQEYNEIAQAKYLENNGNNEDKNNSDNDINDPKFKPINKRRNRRKRKLSNINEPERLDTIDTNIDNNDENIGNIDDINDENVNYSAKTEITEIQLKSMSNDIESGNDEPSKKKQRKI